MKKRSVRWLLVIYDIILYLLVSGLLLALHPSQEDAIPLNTILANAFLGCICVIAARFVVHIYNEIWRYGNIHAFLNLIMADIAGGAAYILLNKLAFALNDSGNHAFSVFVGPRNALNFAIIALNLLLAIAFRMIYCQMYQHGSEMTKTGSGIRKLLKTFGGVDITEDEIRAPENNGRKIRVAIVGAGRLGVALADDFIANPNSMYAPVCFIDVSDEKAGRTLMGLTVLSEAEATPASIAKLDVQEIVFALPQITAEEKNRLYSYYKSTGCRIKVYDYPVTQSAVGGKRQLREFDIEELLPRRTVELDNRVTSEYYAGKVVMITGGGGSIGSELSRQVASMQPKQLVIVDFAENTTYDLQQELKAAYKDSLNLCVEICNICDAGAMRKLFEVYRPQVVLHAAAHKHVPLMEHNCCEAVKNNVFGTKNVADLASEFGVEKFTLISSDKAVNPTNVMGATKRMCEMVVFASKGPTAYTAVRFGNVMGSAGSVIPLFKKQIAAGGPVTITDKRIIRYFMTITEASHLVLEAGAIAKNGELFVLDMGEPVKILDLAESMIKLSGLKPYEDIDIIETGLRPGEKLYEELLMQSDTLKKTENDLIFIENEQHITAAELEEKLDVLRKAITDEDDASARKAMKAVVPTYKSPEEVNSKA